MSKAYSSKPWEMYSIRLQRSLYGLKQSGCMWYNRLSEYLSMEDYMNDEICSYVFIKKTTSEFVILVVYVDDINLIRAPIELQKAIDYLKKEFEMKDPERQSYALICNKHLTNGIFVHQYAYIEKDEGWMDLMEKKKERAGEGGVSALKKKEEKERAGRRERVGSEEESRMRGGGWYSYLWLPFIPLINAFQLAFFAWTWYEFGLKSCYHDHTEDIVIRITMGVLIQILCSYVTLPLYALVTQMGSNMKSTIFNERVATALKNWHHTAKKHVKDQSKHSNPVTPMSSRPGTPSHGMSPVHLLRSHYRSDMGSLQNSPRRSNYDVDHWDNEGSPSPSRFFQEADISSSYMHQIQLGQFDHDSSEVIGASSSQVVPLPQEDFEQHEITIVGSRDFSFEKRTSSI
ncbi:MLO-like protein 6 [Capsicum annuum]|nr:MLO-like protein 6 [Capsicum annuum]